jgi:hypothetical protein
MATMGHWLIEGQILYGIACGHLFYCTEWRRRAPLPAYAEAESAMEQARYRRAARTWRA